MAEEQSLKDQIAAMESWSINIREFISFGNYDEAKKLLREINTQGRRLEWRGGKRGLKHLPEMSQIKVLKINKLSLLKPLRPDMVLRRCQLQPGF